MVALARNPGLDSSELKVLQSAIATLWVLALDSQTHNQLEELDILQLMLTHCRRATEPTVLQYAAGILRVLTIGESGQAARTKLSDGKR